MKVRFDNKYTLYYKHWKKQTKQNKKQSVLSAKMPFVLVVIHGCMIWTTVERLSEEVLGAKAFKGFSSFFVKDTWNLEIGNIFIAILKVPRTAQLRFTSN